MAPLDLKLLKPDGGRGGSRIRTDGRWEPGFTKAPGGGEPKERGDEENETDSQSNIQGAGTLAAVKGAKTLYAKIG